MIVRHSTDIKRLKQQAATSFTGTDIANADTLVIVNATVLTMEGDQHGDLISDGILVSKGGVIETVGHAHSAIPRGATIIDAQGGLLRVI